MISSSIAPTSCSGVPGKAWSQARKQSNATRHSSDGTFAIDLGIVLRQRLSTDDDTNSAAPSSIELSALPSEQVGCPVLLRSTCERQAESVQNSQLVAEFSTHFSVTPARDEWHAIATIALFRRQKASCSKSFSFTPSPDVELTREVWNSKPSSPEHIDYSFLAQQYCIFSPDTQSVNNPNKVEDHSDLAREAIFAFSYRPSLRALFPRP
ncbi:hypothetical protein ACVWXL_009292 [Bradyrhizobium sp. GM22.5]